MSSRGETREQPSIPDPPGLCIEHVSLIVAVVALTIALGAAVVESMTHLDLMLRGGYAILAALIVCGFSGFLAKLILRELAAVKAQRVEVRQMLRYREMMRRRGAAVPVSAGGPHRSSREGDRSEYWTVYSDVLEDLGGLDGPPSEN